MSYTSVAHVNNQFAQTNNVKGMFDISGGCQCPSDAISDPGWIVLYTYNLYVDLDVYKQSLTFTGYRAGKNPWCHI